MVRPLFDTNILIDSIRGVKAATDLLELHPHPAISIVSWMEVLAGARPELEARTRLFLSRFNVIQIDEGVAEEAVLIRRGYRLKLPDAVIWATARKTGRTFFTRDAKDFSADDPRVVIPYRLG